MPTSKALIVIGTSRGGVDALRTLASNLPADLPAALVAVMHTSPASPMALAGILGKVTPLRVTYAEQGEEIECGHFYIAPPGLHTTIISPHHLRLHDGPREQFVRPAVNPLFRSAAEVYGTRVIGIVLTGGLSDGAEGLEAIHAAGGIGIVQEPDEAAASSMPLQALARGSPSHRVPLNEMAALLVNLLC